MFVAFEAFDEMVLGWGRSVPLCSGLVAAYRLRKSGVNVTVFEAADRAGGKIRTNSEGGFLWDEGANTMVSAFQFCLQFDGFDCVVPFCIAACICVTWIVPLVRSQ